MEEGNNNQTTTTDQSCMYTIGNYPTRQNLCLTRIESSRSTTSQIYWATQGRIAPLNPDQFIEKVMQEFQKEIVESIHGQNVPTNV